MNATIIISVALAMLSVIGSATASELQYAHNTETIGGRNTGRLHSLYVEE